MLTLVQKIRANLTTIILWLLVLALSCVPLILTRRQIARTEKTMQTQKLQTTQNAQAARQSLTTGKEDKRDQVLEAVRKKGSYTSTAKGARKTTVKRKTTNYDSQGKPVQMIEEDIINEILKDRQTTAAVDASTDTTISSQSQTSQEIKTSSQQQAYTTIIAEATQTHEVTETPVRTSRLGAAATSAARIAVTYDLKKLGPVALQGLGEVDPGEKKLTGLGGGLSADLRDGRYFAGVHDKYDFEKRGFVIGAHIGMRF